MDVEKLETPECCRAQEAAFFEPSNYLPSNSVADLFINLNKHYHQTYHHSYHQTYNYSCTSLFQNAKINKQKQLAQ